MTSEQDPRPTETVHPHEAGTGAGAEIELLAPGAELAGRFEIRRALGAGGFAHVYLAWDRTLRREVAIKVLRSDRLAPTTLRRFRREAAVARDAAHPNVVRVFEIFESGAFVFLTLEAAYGGTVRDRIAGGPLPLDEALRIAREAFAGLAELHRLGTLHRDVKPSNLLLDDDGSVKVSDFGLALNLGADETRATQQSGLLGTLEYLSPEQALGDELDARSDLYSMGVVLYEMLTGELPHGARSSIGSLLERLRTVRPPDVRAKRPEVPRWLAELVDRLLEVQPGRRYASADRVLADLTAGIGPPPRWGRRLREFAPRILLAAVAAGAVAWSVDEYRDSRFEMIHRVDQKTARAVARDGRTLWERSSDHIIGNFVPFRDRGGELAVAAVPVEDDGYIRSAASRLQVLDPQTGAVRREVDLPPAPFLPAGLADSFTATLTVRDLDGQAPDEILATFFHSPYYPCHAILFEPALDRARILFAASGHHRFVDATDLDGDGLLEILMIGTNNRLGWLNGLAAVRIDPAIGEPLVPSMLSLPAFTPELRSGPARRDPLLWYALLPPANLGLLGLPVEIDAGARRIAVRIGDDSAPIELGFDGFPFDPAATGADRPQRRQARNGAQRGLAEGVRFFNADRPESALPILAEGAAAARVAGDPYLGWILELYEARSLVRTGALDEAASRFEALWGRGRVRSEVAFQAGLELFAAGRREASVDWMQRALAADASYAGGRTKPELLQHLVFVLAALDRLDEAAEEIARFERSMPEHARSGEDVLVSLLAGRPPKRPPEFHSADGELVRYTRLEARVALGDPASEIGRELERSRADGVGPALLYDAAESALLEREGRIEEALELARSALLEARRLGATTPLVAAVTPFLERRLERLERPPRRVGGNAPAGR